jgi:hypothetical protein
VQVSQDRTKTREPFIRGEHRDDLARAFEPEGEAGDANLGVHLLLQLLFDLLIGRISYQAEDHDSNPSSFRGPALPGGSAAHLL